MPAFDRENGRAAVASALIGAGGFFALSGLPLPGATGSNLVVSAVGCGVLALGVWLLLWWAR